MKKLTTTTGLILTLSYSLFAQNYLEYSPGTNASKNALGTDYEIEPKLLIKNTYGSVDQSFEKKEKNFQFKPHSTNAFHIKGGGSINLIGSGFSIEPQYVTKKNIAFGLQFSKWTSVQVFSNNTNMREDNQIKSILASVEKRYSENASSGYIGFRMGIFTTDPGAPIFPNTTKGERYSRLGINLNGGAYLWILYVEAGLGVYGDFEANLNFKAGLRI